MNMESHFSSPKSWEEESKLLQERTPRLKKTKWAIKGKTGNSIFKLLWVQCKVLFLWKGTFIRI